MPAATKVTIIIIEIYTYLEYAIQERKLASIALHYIVPFYTAALQQLWPYACDACWCV